MLFGEAVGPLGGGSGSSGCALIVSSLVLLVSSLLCSLACPDVRKPLPPSAAFPTVMGLSFANHEPEYNLATLSGFFRHRNKKKN